jgi:hypothetical protein
MTTAGRRRNGDGSGYFLWPGWLGIFTKNWRRTPNGIDERKYKAAGVLLNWENSFAFLEEMRA